MSQEKIAFLFPYNGKAGEDKIPPPLLAYDCEEFPAELDMSAGIFFIGLHHEKPYYLEIQVIKDESTAHLPVSKKRGMWVRVSDTHGHETDMAASIDINLLRCRFDEPGSYYIDAALLVNEKEVHRNRAYFRVSKAS